MILSGDDRVPWSKQQRIVSRKKRDFLREPKVLPYPAMMMGKNRIQTTDPKWPQMWYLVSELDIFRIIFIFIYVSKCVTYQAIDGDEKSALLEVWFLIV